MTGAKFRVDLWNRLAPPLFGKRLLATRDASETRARPAIGDIIDIAALSGGLRPDNPRRENANLALAMVIGIAALDLLAARSVTARHRRGNGWRDYRDRSGFPKGLRTARSAAGR